MSPSTPPWRPGSRSRRRNARLILGQHIGGRRVAVEPTGLELGDPDLNQIALICRKLSLLGSAADAPSMIPTDRGTPPETVHKNPPYGMIGGIEETSASFEARSAPRSYPTLCCDAQRGHSPTTMW